jgi:hypothetical protein
MGDGSRVEVGMITTEKSKLKVAIKSTLRNGNKIEVFSAC